MGITDELRKWAGGSTISSWTAEHLTAIADRIDAEHRKAEDEWRAKNGDMWLKGYNACHEELMEGHPVIVADLENAGWVRLPVDADGVPIHIGDVLTDDAEFKSEGKVMRLMLEDEGWMVGIGCAGWTEPSIHEWHHHHAPTVEDVLTEFGIDWEHESDCEDRAALLKEYAAKFRFADEKE